MFRSKELNGPSKKQIDESLISKTFVGSPNGILPKTTSTPLNHGTPQSRRNRVLQPVLSRQGTPRRYSLSDTNSATPKPHSNPYASNSPGPLLASMSFADNVSLYEETKSSGLAKRIVSYREAQEEQHPTHQEKYNSPGLFPVVHLFKNSTSPLPTKKVKVKLASPEYLRSYSPQHRSKILEEISKPRLHRQLSLPAHAHNNDAGTKSVLDALKEISRKRIHSNEDIDPLEDLGKRPKTDLYNGNVAGTSKRVRADSPLSDQADSPSIKQRQKKFCVYDEFAASKSSSDFSYLTKSELSKSKRKALNTSTESLLIEPKQVKVANAETQTPAPEPESKLEATEPQPEETIKELKKKKDYPLKVFDDAPLQRIRKSRLAALMGTMLGKDIVIPIEEQTADIVNEAVGSSNSKKSMDEPKVSEVKKTDSTDSVLKSILTPVTSSEEIAKPKNVEEKHVHFNIPTTTSTVISEPSLTQSSTAISLQSEKTIKESSPVSVSAVKTTPETSKPAFSFGSVSKTDTAVSSASVSTPMFSFPKPTTESKSDSKVTTSPPKIGGFKFDLKAPSVNKTTVPSLDFPVITTTVTTTASSSTFAFGTPAVTSTPVFSFGSPASQSVAFAAPPKSDIPVSATEVKPTDAKSTVTAPVTIATSTFGSIPPADTGFKFGAVTSQPQQPASLGSSVTSASTPTTNVSATTTSAAPSIFGGFGSAGEQTGVNKPQPPSFAFGGASSAFTSNSATFGAITTSTPTSSTFTTSVGGGFGSTTNTDNKSPAVFGGFGGTQAKPTPTFGSTTTAAPSFGANPTTSTSFGSNTATLPTFGSNTTTTVSSLFSTAPASTTSATFGTTTSTATFKFAVPVTSTPAFGQNLTSSSATPAFASPAAVKPNAFGSSTFGGSSAPAFGSSAATNNQTSAPTFGGSSAPAFGSSTAPTNQKNTLIAFGGNNPPTFGSSTAPINQNSSATTFGGNSTPAFGSSNNQNATSTFGSGSNAFGTSTTNQNPSPFGGSAFAAPVPTTTTAPSMFGSGNTATSTFAFGANKQQPPNPFGGGVTSTTTAGSSFGSSSTFSSPASSTSGSFSFGGPAPAFGTNAQKSTFGASSAPSFGQTENKPTFSFGAGSTEPKAVPSFGSGASAPTFGAPSTNNNHGFGSGATSAFGATNSTGSFGSQPQSNGGFNFGANSAGSNTFAFGSNANKEVPKPTFNFTGNANPPAFGTAATPAFGASSSFPSQPQQFMGASAPAGGVFTIGSGSTPGSRPRAQIRAKRRT